MSKIFSNLEEWVERMMREKDRRDWKNSQPKYQNIEVGDSVNIEELYKPHNKERITIERLRGNDFYLIEYQLRIKLEKQRRKFKLY